MSENDQPEFSPDERRLADDVEQLNVMDMEQDEREDEEAEATPLDTIVADPDDGEQPYSIDRCIEEHGVNVRFGNKTFPAWSQEMLNEGTGRPVHIPEITCPLVVTQDVDTVQCLYTPSQFSTIQLGSCVVYGHNNYQKSNLGRRCHLYHGDRKVGLFKHTMLFRTWLDGVTEGEVYLVRLNPHSRFDLAGMRKKFHQALIESSKSIPASPFPRSWSKWCSSTKKEKIRAKGVEVMAGWNQLLTSMEPHHLNQFNQSYRLVYSSVDIKRGEEGFGELSEKLAHLRSVAGDPTNMNVDIGLMVCPE